MNATQNIPGTVGVDAAFEPRLVALVCKWCTYAGADLAGTSRMAYPANVQAIMLPCTGRIDISLVIKAFLQGADGVLVSGCHPGDCHYTAGNFRARRRWTLLRDLLDTVGFDLRRLQFAWISAAEGAKWVKTIASFTDFIRDLGPYSAMRRLASDHKPAPAPPAVALPMYRKPPPARSEPKPAPPALIASIKEAFESGTIRTMIGWMRGKTLGGVRAGWMMSAAEVDELMLPDEGGNLARLLKHPWIKASAPVGIVTRRREWLAINVILQDKQLDPAQIVMFVVDEGGQFAGRMPPGPQAAELFPGVAQLSWDALVGFSESTLAQLDELMARTPQERWAFWTGQFDRCIKCYACRQSCPLCNCDECFADRNQPQWFPTAADGPGNFAWHLVRAFHLAGRCIGCGACESACPCGIPINLLSAAMARSALKHFGFRAGLSMSDPPLQAAFRSDDDEAFIL